MQRDWGWKKIGLAAFTATMAVSPAPLRAQQDIKRKVKTQVEAQYPELARKYNLAGRVRLSVIVTKDGKVKSCKVLGGNAVLANSAQEALKEWKFLPGTEETTETIEFEFKPKA